LHDALPISRSARIFARGTCHAERRVRRHSKRPSDRFGTALEVLSVSRPYKNSGRDRRNALTRPQLNSDNCYAALAFARRDSRASFTFPDTSVKAAGSLTARSASTL